ncbi:MAG TPA: Flp pilus assembly protein CpaB [Egibacteraceae bacterium]|nr:Flp pilus assembly protein CpaB [Egibacteraceae bacterium]
MRNKTTLAGAVLGVIGAGLLALFVAQAAGPAKAEATVTALVVNDGLAPGMGAPEVGARVREAEVPASLAPAGRIVDLDELAGRKVVRSVGAGEILTASQFAAAGPAAGGLVVPSGYEAITLEAEPAPGVQGYVTPGSRVNVYATVAGDGAAGDPAAGQPYTQLVLGHVDVLAVTPGTLTGESQDPAAKGSDGRIVLLLQVLPEDTPVLVHAQKQGSLWFTLVNPNDPPPGARRVQVGDLDAAQRTHAIGAARARQDAERAAHGGAGQAQVTP